MPRQLAISPRGLLIGVLFAVLVTALFRAGAQWSPLLLRLEHQLGDWRTGLLSDRHPAQHERIALVLVDERTLQKEAYTSPVDRRVLARLVDRLDQLGAKAIALDVLFYRPTEPAKDAELIASLRNSKAQVILAAGDERTALTDEERRFQRDFLARAGRSGGYANIDEDRDEVVRRRLGPVRGGEFPHSFATLIAASDGAADPDPQGRIAWLKRADNEANAFFDVNARDVLEDTASGAAVREQFRGRLVLIGGGFPDRDRHRTPLFTRDRESDRGKLHGVYLHAHALAQLLDRRSVTEVAEWPVVLALSFLGYCLGLSFWRHGFSWMLGGLWTALLIAVDLLAFWKLRLVVPYMPASLAWIVGTTGGYLIGRLAGWRSRSQGEDGDAPV